MMKITHKRKTNTRQLRGLKTSLLLILSYNCNAIEINEQQISVINGQLETPAQGTTKSGIGIVRGWYCDAEEITLIFDGATPFKVAYLNERGDTQSVCGDTNNGFELLVNWNLFSAGNHVVEAFADGELFGSVNYDVAPLSANNAFLTGLSRNKRIENFPALGKYTDMSWSQANQNFIINHTGLMADDDNQEEPEVGVVGDNRLDLIVNYVKNKYHLPAMAAMIVRGNGFVEKSAMGLRSINAQESITSNDQLHIGSITKSMTSTLAALLVKKGIINWDTTLEEVFPELVSVMKPEYKDIQLQELLSHISGLPNSYSIFPNDGEDSYTDDRDVKIQRHELTEIVVKNNSTNVRGEYAYNNLAYVIAGAMFEKLTGQSWEDLIQSYVFNPLLMKNTGFYAPDTQSTLAQPIGHIWDNQWLPVDPSYDVTADSPKVLGPAGLVHVTLSDMAKYIQFHLQGLKGNPVEGMLNADEFAQLYTPRSTNGEDGPYGLGWIVENGGNVIVHDGSNNLWEADLLIDAENDVAFFIAMNASGDEDDESTSEGFQNVQSAVDELITKLAERYFSSGFSKAQEQVNYRF